MSYDNEYDVLHHMECFGIKFRPKDRAVWPRVDTAKRVVCGEGGKYWYRLSVFRPDAGGAYLVGRYGSYRTGESEKVIVDWTEVSKAERERLARERAARADRDAAERKRLEAEAAMSAAELWHRGARTGNSAYLKRKGVEGESCRYMPDGSILVPLIRYDLPRADALRGLQRIYPGPRTHWRTNEALPEKTFTPNFEMPGSALRLGEIKPMGPILVCEGYATALSIRMALNREWPVFMALVAGNLLKVCQIIRKLHDNPIVLCADDDWRTLNHKRQPDNVGRRKAIETAKAVSDVHIVYPSFGPGRGDKHTDFNDLHALAGLEAVRRQLMRVVNHVAGLTEN